MFVTFDVFHAVNVQVVESLPFTLQSNSTLSSVTTKELFVTGDAISTIVLQKTIKTQIIFIYNLQ